MYVGGMPYPKKLLNDYEEVAVDLHPHWWFYAKPALAVVGAIALGILTLLFTDGDTSTRTFLGWLSLAGLLASVVWLVVRYARWATTNFVITSDRLIYRSGVIAKKGIEIPLERVNTVHFNQSIFERILGAGDVLIESGGEEGQQAFTDIRRPDRVQNQIHTQMEVNERRRFTVNAPPTATDDVATQLEKLEGLMNRGTLTKEEFDAQKARLLGS